MTLPYASNFANEIFVTGANVDHGAEALLASFSDRQGDALDVGANIGYYSLYLAPQVRSVHAFEPDPRNLSVLRLNTRGVENVHIVEAAVSDRRGTVHLDIGSDPEISHVLPEPRATTVEVPATTIDAYVSEHPSIWVSAIKIDVEGHDLAVLRGSEETIAAFSPLVLTEFSVHAEGANDRRVLYDLCERHQYQIWGYAYPAGKPSPRVVLTELAEDGTMDAKMLFLVPARLHGAFASKRG
jgi:FkbM family methyltransferase